MINEYRLLAEWDAGQKIYTTKKNETIQKDINGQLRVLFTVIFIFQDKYEFYFNLKTFTKNRRSAKAKEDH